MTTLNDKIDALSKALADYIAHPPVVTVNEDPATAAKLDALTASVATLQSEVGADNAPPAA